MINIRRYRLMAMMTQADLAARCGVGATTVTMWETGKRMPTVLMIKKISQILNCTVDDLLADLETEKVPKEA